MDLYIFHRVLIVAAIVFDVFFTTFCIRKYNISGDTWELVWAALSSLIVVGLAAYLVYFNRKTARLQELRKNMVNCPNCDYDLRGSTDSQIAECPECGHAISDELRKQAMAL